jgi:hypothetical protein
MWFVRRLMTFAASAEVYKNAAVLDFNGIRRDTVFFKTGLTNATATVKFPIVPRADDIIAV